MYVQLQKVVYSTLLATLLFWEDLSGCVHNKGNKSNLYNQCVVNKMVYDKQSTALWHVDDLKLSHIDRKCNQALLDWLNKWYGAETPLTEIRGDLHNYLGMTIDYSTPGKVMIWMDNYVENVLNNVNKKARKRLAHQWQNTSSRSTQGQQNSTKRRLTTSTVRPQH